MCNMISQRIKRNVASRPLRANYHECMKWAHRIKVIRKSLGMTQEQLAAALNKPQGTISGWERGVREPDLETFGLIAAALEVHPAFLIYGINMAPGGKETMLTSLSEKDRRLVLQMAESLLQVDTKASPSE